MKCRQIHDGKKKQMNARLIDPNGSDKDSNE